MVEYTVLILLALLLLVGPPVLSIIAMLRANDSMRLIQKTQSGLDQVLRQVAVLRSELSAIQDQPDAVGTTETLQEEEAPPVADVEKEPSGPESGAEEPQTPLEPPPHARPWDRPAESIPVRSAAQQSAAPVTGTVDAIAEEKQSFEEVLASRWLVWLGAIVIGLGSIFFVKFAIDQGLLGPAVRDSLTFSLGIVLVAGGEWLRRRPLQRAIAAIRPNYVPLALTASGLFAAFASIYAAHVFHGLLPPLPAFAGLAVVAFVAVGLSLLQGKFVALLGLLGAAATPLLIATPHRRTSSFWTCRSPLTSSGPSILEVSA